MKGEPAAAACCIATASLCAFRQLLHVSDVVSGFLVRTLHSREDCLVGEDVVELRLAEVRLEIVHQLVVVSLQVCAQCVVLIDRRILEEKREVRRAVPV